MSHPARQEGRNFDNNGEPQKVILRSGNTSARFPDKADVKQIVNQKYLRCFPKSSAHQARDALNSFEPMISIEQSGSTTNRIEDL
jgi:hypothetical protein